MQKQDPATFRLETQLKPGSNAAEILGHGPPSLMLMVMMMLMLTLMMMMVLTLMKIVRILMIIPMTQPGSLCQGHPDEDDDDEDEDDHNARFPRTSLSEPPSLMLMVMTMLMTTMAHLSHDLEEKRTIFAKAFEHRDPSLGDTYQPG